MIEQVQLFMNLPQRGTRSQDWWLGLELDYRRLFDALQDEWLRPPAGSPGWILAVTRFAEQVTGAEPPHRIRAHLQLDPRRLPHVPVWIKRLDRWVAASLDEVSRDDEAILWPGAIPTFAISRIAVPTREEHAQLSGLARMASNITLPQVPLDVEAATGVTIDTHDLPDQTGRGLEIPESLDAARGAMAMAIWAVPRIDPWLDLLVASLTGDANRLERLTEAVGASWLKWPAWDPPEPLTLLSSGPDAAEAALWRAATFELSRRPVEHGDSVEVVDRIAARACRLSSLPSENFEGWQRSTIAVLRADEKLRLDEWKISPVGKALQLVLSRPQPERYMTWAKSAPELAPAVWWSGAILCGLLHGYRQLPTSYRGEIEQRRWVALEALRRGSTPNLRDLWPSELAGPVSWKRSAEEFVITCGDVELARKPAQERGRWYTADLDDASIRSAADELARRSKWPCFEQQLALSDIELALSGTGSLELPSNHRHLGIRGAIQMRLPASAKLEPVLSSDLFRRCVATEAGVIPAPPPPTQSHSTFRQPSESAYLTAQLDTAAARDPNPKRIAHPRLPGLIYESEFLSEDEERALVAVIDQAEWSDTLKRRVQHYGWRYDYRARQIDASMKLGELPPWAEQLARRLYEAGLLPHVADQVIVNEYRGKQGISKHVDSELSFADGIATISLLESWEMMFSRSEPAPDKETLLLERRSIAVLSGEARYAWTHEIPGRVKDSSGRRRSRRISITFRKVLPPTPIHR
jgi:alkylated DNA repair dioxygenase AlkB